MKSLSLVAGRTVNMLNTKFQYFSMSPYLAEQDQRRSQNA